ncbi:glycosyltransferase [Mesorhizobium australicum]|uniref:glycosyltransferase n=1 Tax=Mesorhizobium australicum TaxID=536018 RepID=UPI003336E65D
MLISHHILTQQHRSAVSATTSKLAFLCHDLIPTLRPDLVGAGIGETRYGSYLEHFVRIGVLRFRRGWRDVERSHAQGRRRRACGVPVSDALHPPRDRFAHGRDLPHRDRRTVCNLLFHHPSTKEPHPLGAHWRQALDEGVKRSKLVCAGRWGWMIEPLRAYLKTYPKLSESVTFTGLVSDEELIQYYRSASFGVFPSHIEGWGYGASKCLDFGIPVIVSTAPSLIEERRHDAGDRPQ